MIDQKSEKNIVRLSLILLLAFFLCKSFLGEKLPFNNGMGWDGDYYARLIKDFPRMYFGHEINYYQIQRIFPFFLLYYIFDWFNITANSVNIINACLWMHTIFIFVSIIYYFKLSDTLGFNTTTDVLGFCMLFYNVPVLKIWGYMPVLGDSTAFMLSFMALYFFINKNKLLLIIIGLIAMISYPILSLLVFVLIAFPTDTVDVCKVEEIDNKSVVLAKIIRATYVLWVPFIWGAYMIASYLFRPERSWYILYGKRPPVNLLIGVLSLVSIALFYFYATRIFSSIKWSKIFVAIVKKDSVTHILISLLAFLVFFFLSRVYGVPGGSNPIEQIAFFATRPSSDILLFLESHFLYLGLFFLLILFYWNSIIKVVAKEFGVGYFLIVMIALAFLMETETRRLSCFYPFFLVPLLISLNKETFRGWVPYAFVVFSLILSCFWYDINVPGIEQSFIDRVDNYKVGLAQRFFLFWAPWQSHKVYYIVSLVEIIIGAVIVFLHNKDLLYNKR